MPAVYRRAAARRDLVERYLNLAENASVEIADRFLLRAQESFHALLEQPNIGSPLALKAPELAGIRKWHVREFESVLIFYLPHAEGISIVRVLHAAQDWWRLLGLV